MTEGFEEKRVRLTEISKILGESRGGRGRGRGRRHLPEDLIIRKPMSPPFWIAALLDTVGGDVGAEDKSILYCRINQKAKN